MSKYGTPTVFINMSILLLAFVGDKWFSPKILKYEWQLPQATFRILPSEGGIFYKKSVACECKPRFFVLLSC